MSDTKTDEQIAWDLLNAAETEASFYNAGIRGSTFASAVSGYRAAASWLDEGPGAATDEMHCTLARIESMLPDWVRR